MVFWEKGKRDQTKVTELSVWESGGGPYKKTRATESIEGP